MEFTKPARNIKHPTAVQTKCSGKIRNRNYALHVIPPEPGMKPSDSISNFHGNGIAEAWVYNCSRILETKGKTKENKNMVQKSSEVLKIMSLTSRWKSQKVDSLKTAGRYKRGWNNHMRLAISNITSVC